MSRLSKVIKVLNDMVTEDEDQEYKRREALASLEALKPVVPIEVYIWYQSLGIKSLWNPQNVLEMYRKVPEQIPPSVRDWIAGLQYINYVTLYDIARFGIRKEQVSLYVIKTASNMCMANEYYVIKKDVDSYQLTTDINKATKFTYVQLSKVPRALKVGWEIKEVYA